ncbi:OmpP1/FadL family transporter [Luteimonas mephitis]|uniref:OmpP1/FadL family transporter n=1 Tax=Luteimonas mephitis TaxID=83615 RepID=UPI0003F4D37B|nr:outer membrane protein transport protein [Luteimonas mephitis]
MQTHPRLIQITALALGIAGAMAFTQAHAAAFLLKENSVKAQGRSMAGAASAKGDASVVANNPAVMSTFDKNTFQADMTAIDLSFKFTGGGQAAAGSPLAQPLTGGNGGDAGGLNAVPAMSFIMPLSGQFEYVTLGAMISAPFGLKTEYDDNWVGRYHAIKSDVKIIDLTLAASLDLSDRFSVGAGLIYEHSDVTLSNAIDFGSGICANPQTQPLCFMPNPVTGPYGPQKQDGKVSVNGTDNTFGWILGMNWRPTDSLSFGYSHRSEVDHEVRGTATFTVPGTAAFITAGGAYTSGPAGAKLTLPSTDTFSATWDATDKLTLMAEATLAGWDSLKEIRIEFDNPVQPDAAEDYSWKDSWFYSVGAEYKLNERWTVRGGVARDDSPVSLPHRTPRMPDQDRMWYSLGATWAVSDSLDITASYSRIQLADTPVIGIASSSGSYISGKYDGGADNYGISAQYRF